MLELPDGRLALVEVKATSSPTPSDARGLRHLRAQAADRVIASVLLHTGNHCLPLGDGIWALPLTALWAPLNAA